jgi:molybdate transport system substrate-binding protein
MRPEGPVHRPSPRPGAAFPARLCGRLHAGLPVGLLAGLCLLAGGCGGADAQRPAPTVTVYAAASLTDVVQELADRFREREGVEVRTSFAASSTLAQQILRGAPADLFLSANTEWMDHLEREGLLEPGSRRDLLSNRLVLVSPSDEPVEVDLEPGFDLAGAFEGRLAVADPEAVPAGLYARRALESLGHWEALRERLAVAAHVRGALALVERGECPLGAVYRTDAAMSARVIVVAELPEEATGPIVYPVSALDGRLRPEVRSFLLFLLSDEARRTFEARGFLVVAPGLGAPGLSIP